MPSRRPRCSYGRVGKSTIRRARGKSITASGIACSSNLSSLTRRGSTGCAYQDIRADEQKLLKNYLQTLQAMPISSYNRREQQAYWINLYNAFTVDLIVSRLPVTSIRDINISPSL